MSTIGDIAIAFASGGAGGTLTSLLTPWAQWGVDKRRRQMETRTRIIEDARELVHQGQDMDRKDILLDPRYLAIRPYLRPEAEEKLRVQSLVAVSDPYGTVGNYFLAVIRDEADRLAREWAA
jgi:hypothetical protein